MMLRRVVCVVRGHDWSLHFLHWGTTQAIHERCQRCRKSRSKPLTLNSDRLWVQLTRKLGQNAK